MARGLAEGQDEGMWRCLGQILDVASSDGLTQEVASIPLSLGG